jgi:hypothetical protein
MWAPSHVHTEHKETPDIASSKSRVHFPCLSLLQRIISSLSVCRSNIVEHDLPLLGIVSPLHNTQTGGPPLVGCPILLVRYIRSDPPYQEISVRHLRTRHAVVTTAER